MLTCRSQRALHGPARLFLLEMPGTGGQGPEGKQKERLSSGQHFQASRSRAGNLGWGGGGGDREVAANVIPMMPSCKGQDDESYLAARLPRDG